MSPAPPVQPGDVSPAAIAHNLHAVRQNIHDAARRAGRDPHDIRLIAVSKTVPRAAVEAAIDAGQLDFGENTIQDALSKIPCLRERAITWHFIGHLQSNKVKFVPANFTWVHSLDRLPLAEKLSAHAERHGVRLSTLIQVNVSGDPKKHGVASRATYELVEQILAANLKGITLCGLMTLGPYHADEKTLHDCFARLRMLRDDCIDRFGLTRFTELSMGMTDDYPVAIAEGATMVRIGTAIFGPRAYP